MSSSVADGGGLGPQRCPCPKPAPGPGSPAVAVGGVDVGSRRNEEVYDGVVGAADGVVQGRDALLIGLTWVIHLGGCETERLSTPPPTCSR